MPVLPVNVVTKLKGSGSGAYTTVSASYVPVDAANLAVALITPTSQMIMLWASGDVFNNTVSDNSGIAIAKDGAVVAEQALGGTGAGTTFPFNICYSEAGDGSSHTWALYFKAYSGTTDMNNSSASRTPFLNILQIVAT